VATDIKSSISPSNQIPAAPVGERNYPLNCWWVAAFSDEVNSQLLGRWLLDIPVLLYRTTDGRAVAMEDRCPHRSAPLSLGCLRGDNVECGYHGFTFAPDGTCVRVPSMAAAVPPSLRVRSFPVVEQFPFVWVYLGDPNKLSLVPSAPTLDWAEDKAFGVVKGRMDMAVNYMLLKENVLDLTHFGFVHAKSFKITDWVAPPQVIVEGDRVTYRQTFDRSPLPAMYADPLHIKVGTPFNREQIGAFVSPALQIAAVDFKDPEVNSNVPVGRFRVVHATTPIDATHMHYFWVVARDHGTSKAELTALEERTTIGFREDEQILEAVQRVILRDRRPIAAQEVSVKADTAAIQARRAVQRWMARE
jgi:phenylpropionate dioxygenase-like ring-hydroxylating dioxygenase large terminal subunit